MFSSIGLLLFWLVDTLKLLSCLALCFSPPCPLSLLTGVQSSYHPHCLQLPAFPSHSSHKPVTPTAKVFDFFFLFLSYWQSLLGPGNEYRSQTYTGCRAISHNSYSTHTNNSVKYTQLQHPKICCHIFRKKVRIQLISQFKNSATITNFHLHPSSSFFFFGFYWQLTSNNLH